jgi:hypothetical protein
MRFFALSVARRCTERSASVVALLDPAEGFISVSVSCEGCISNSSIEASCRFVNVTARCSIDQQVASNFRSGPRRQW